jgi:uncharacterized repeat protein (TIGR04138 family)
LGRFAERRDRCAVGPSVSPQAIAKIWMSSKVEKNHETVILEDGRYPLEAYAFLEEGFKRAVRHLRGDCGDAEGRHVSGQKICHALRELALERWGGLAGTVLAQWNVKSTIDFGNMVYLLIEHEFLKKTEDDSLEDFRDVYDFAEAFSIDDGFSLGE